MIMRTIPLKASFETNQNNVLLLTTRIQYSLIRTIGMERRRSLKEHKPRHNNGL